MNETVAHWREDTDRLSKLLLTYFPQGWEVHRQEILADKNQKLAYGIMNNPNLNRIGNGCRILNTWIRLFKKLNNASGMLMIVNCRCF